MHLASPVAKSVGSNRWPGPKVSGLGFRFYNLGFRAEGLGFTI